jgi:hypothetical protein
MYFKGLFAMMDYLQFIDIYHLSIDRQKFNNKAVLGNIFNVKLLDMMQDDVYLCLNISKLVFDS